MNATEIKTEIERLEESRSNQVNVEFEGYHPEHEMPQDRTISKLYEELHSSGHIIMDGEIYSRNEIQSIRESFNGKVRKFMADDPGQRLPTTLMQSWEAEVGMKCQQIKHAVKTLGM